MAHDDPTATIRIGELAAGAKVSLRTLRYYDEIGLLRPSARSAAGYRLYSSHDVLRLQQIRSGQALGFSLDEIQAQLDDPGFDLRAALLERRAAVSDMLEQGHALLASINATLAAFDSPATPLELAEIFAPFDPRAHEDEVEARWGESAAFKESTRRTSAYRAEDWTRIRDAQAGLVKEFSACLVSGHTVDSLPAMELAEQHRLFIDSNFYPCTRTMHASLADLYVQDERFAAHFDAAAPGLALFVADSIRCNRIARGDG